MIGQTDPLAASAEVNVAARRQESAPASMANDAVFASGIAVVCRVRDAAPPYLGAFGPAEDAGLQARLLTELPAALRVLAVGAHSERLAAEYRARHPGAAWRSAAWDAAAIRAAAPECDLVVVADGFAAVADACTLLRVLHAHCDEDVRLVVAMHNDACADGLVRLIEGDLTTQGGVDAVSRRPSSPASVFKLMMDAGWMPRLAGAPCGNPFSGVELAVAAAAAALVETLDVPGATAVRRLNMHGLVVEAGRLAFREPQAAAAKCAEFAVVVPVTRRRQFDLNVAISPGLKEVQAQVVTVDGASSASDALEQALPHVAADWVLLCHQDVYFPAGFGRRLNAVLAAVPVEARDKTLIGFAGMAVDAQHQGYARAGFVVDRLHRFDHADSATAVSIDELAVVVSRRSLHRIDPRLGWHLWATGLCLAAVTQHQVFARIVRLPIFHNSLNDYTLPTAFHASAERLAADYPEFGPIPTLCGTIDAAFLALHRPAVEPPPKARVAAPAPADGATAYCCICDRPVDGWMPHPHLARRSEFMKLLDAVGSDLSRYQCPSCHSTDRDRHLWLYLLSAGLPQRMGTMHVLHIAPERHLEALIHQIGPRAYVRGDLHPTQPHHARLDIEALDFADESFDLIVCNHVLEHVASPARALAEFHRCLSPGGTLVAQTPYAPSLARTLELNRPVSNAFAKLFYGQEDHVRLFGADIVDMIHAAGFSGALRSHAEMLGELDAQAAGCNVREPFFCFSR